MIKEIKVRSNGNAICIDENGGSIEYDLLKPLIDKLKQENQVTSETKITDSFLFSTKLEEWYPSEQIEKIG